MTIPSRRSREPLDQFFGRLSKWFFDRSDELEAISREYEFAHMRALLMEQSDRLRRLGEMYEQRENVIDAQMRDKIEGGEAE